MATKLYQSGAGVVSETSNPMLYDKTYDVIKALQDEVPKVNLQLVREESQPIGKSYTEGEVSSELGLPFVSTDSEKIRLLTPIFGHSKTITLVEVRAGIAITRRAEESQKTRMLKVMMQGLPASMDRKVEYTISGLINNGFASTTGADGSYAFASDHTKADASQAAWSNLGTAAGFTTASYSLARLAMRNRTGQRGYPDSMVPTQIIYPTALDMVVKQVLGSPKVAEFATNGINPYMNDVKPIENVWLSSATAWFLRDGSNKDLEGFVLVWGQRPDYQTISWSDNPDIIWGKRLRAVLAAGCVHARNWQANAGG